MNLLITFTLSFFFTFTQNTDRLSLKYYVDTIFSVKRYEFSNLVR
jgi:hypothetical protein